MHLFRRHCIVVTHFNWKTSELLERIVTPFPFENLITMFKKQNLNSKLREAIQNTHLFQW